MKSVFTIDDLEDNDSSANDDASAPHDSDQGQALLEGVADRTVGTAGCCGAMCVCFGCLCCGMYWKEMHETYNRFTLCGLWCPM
jgi:hypothetical protein